MELKKISISDKNIQDFISLNSNCIFNCQDWLKILKEGFNSEVHYYALLDNGALAIALSAILLDFKLVKVAYSNMPYGGLFGKKEYAQEFLRLLENKLKGEGIHIFRITKRFDEDFGNPDGYRVKQGYQQILDLGGLTEDKLWHGYKKRVRRDVLKAQKSGIKVTKISDRADIERLYELYQDTALRNRTYTTWTKNSFYSIYDNLILKEKADIMFAETGNKFVAGIILIYSPDTVYYFMSASLTGYLKYCPNDLLLHTAIISGIRKNKRYFDLMTCKYKDTALLKFKEKWGARCYPFAILEKDLDFQRAIAWNLLYRMANSRLGSFLIRSIRRHS